MTDRLQAMSIFFFFNDTATTEIYTLSLHDALPICLGGVLVGRRQIGPGEGPGCVLRSFAHGADPTRSRTRRNPDRKSTRLNSSHSQISYAVFCLKKKNQSCRADRALLCRCVMGLAY